MILKNKLPFFLSFVFAAFLALAFLLFAYAQKTEASRISAIAPPPQGQQYFEFFSATTTTATSTNTTDGGQYFVINNAKKVTFYFTHGGVATTSTAGSRFSIQTTRDGTNWDYFPRLINFDASSTATTTYTIQGATTTVPVSMYLQNDTFYGVRCISTEIASPLGTDGEATCQATAEF